MSSSVVETINQVAIEVNAPLSHLPQRPPLDLEFQNLNYIVKVKNGNQKKTILKGISGHFKSSELTAIMGPSGSGKSTLLNILTGYITLNVTGSIKVNGEERNLSVFRKQSAYIMQDNQLYANLTVAEALSVASNLKLSSTIPKSDKIMMIKEILETLSLLEHRGTMTGRLSGGQQKRLSIALELVSNPPIMFFDEPTSGLDSSTSYQCINLLKCLAEGGRTIICTIHQPSSRLFQLFDNLYMLWDGQCLFQGHTKMVVPFLNKYSLTCPSYHNPASFVIEVACGEHGCHSKRLVNAIQNGQINLKKIDDLRLIRSDALDDPIDSVFNNHGESSGVSNTVQSNHMQYQPERYATSEYKQFFTILKRAFLFSRRDWALMYLRLFAHILVSTLIGGLFYDIGNDGAKVISNLGFLFFNMMFLMYTAMTITILSFPLELPVLQKENFNRWYSLRSYYMAITFCDIPFQTICCVIYVTIVYLMTSQPLEWYRYFMFLGSCLLVAFVAQSIGLVIGSCMNVQNGVFLAPVMSVPFLLFSGFFVSFDAIPGWLRWLTYLSYIRYGFEGTALSVYSFNRTTLKCHQMYCHFKNPHSILDKLDMLDANYELDIAALIIFFIVLRILAYLLLKTKLKTNR